MSILLTLIFNGFNLFLSYVIYPNIHYIFKYIGNTVFIIQVISQFYTTIVNPGIPHRNNYVSHGVMETLSKYARHNETTLDKYRVCKECNILVKLDQSVIHCEECNICIEDLDHHCGWIGKCIAKRNLSAFNVFLITTLSYFVYLIFSLIVLMIVGIKR
jgi:hypothetical protein